MSNSRDIMAASRPANQNERQRWQQSNSTKNMSETYNKPVEIREYKARLHFGDTDMPTSHKKDVEHVINATSSYRQDATGSRLKETENKYRNMPLMQGSGTRDIDMETYIKYGCGSSTDSKNKSRGYPNTFEHNFQYISADMQSPDHTVLERGISSRVYNKATARTAGREIMF